MAEAAKPSHPGVLCINWMTALARAYHPFGDAYLIFVSLPIDDWPVLGSCSAVKKEWPGCCESAAQYPILNEVD